MTHLWGTDEIFKFLELYQSEPVIWNPKHDFHKDRRKIHDAWKRITNDLGVPISELKKKRESLMSTFRLHFKRKQDSIQSGEEVYKPIWIYYLPMEAFLKDIYECKSNFSIEDDSSSSFEQETPISEQEPKIRHKKSIVCKKDPSKVHSIKKRRLVRPSGMISLQKVEEKIADTFKKLNHALNKERESDDDCALYGKLLAHKLRQYSDRERVQIMYEIDGLLLRRSQNFNEMYHEPPKVIIDGRQSSTGSSDMEPEFLET